jgi:protocatechuate 4,5-dioxygenase alpha chain
MQARKGHVLKQMRFSFNDAAYRAAVLADEDAYCTHYGLNEHQRAAIRS